MVRSRHITAWLSHGPLLAWAAMFLAVAGFLAASYQAGAGERPAVQAYSAYSPESEWEAVMAWRAAAATIPVSVSAADGSYAETARQLAGFAEAQAEKSTGVLADAWRKAASAAEALAAAEDVGERAAASFGLSLAGDRLVAALWGVEVPEVGMPDWIPVGGEPGGPAGTGTGTGAGTPDDPAGAVNGPGPDSEAPWRPAGDASG